MNETIHLGMHYTGMNVDNQLEYFSDIHDIAILLSKDFSLVENKNMKELKTVFSFQKVDGSKNEDSKGFEIYTFPKTQVGQINTEQGFRLWHDANINSQNIIQLSELQMPFGKLWRTQEQDGVDSTGRYYYFENNKYCFMIMLFNISQNEIESIISKIQI
ncbi:MAG: hypothetical protein V1853_04945 [bacterium]